ncbi:hypothetical protein IWX78_001244 [Mycetocola sp. CAN_C7]|uniref:DUF1648 domain-containing protein n=1 Tax=Mycetocola sp. CAN_C7 TaxID=2787724 RepID=UPI0018CBA5F5
MTDDQRTIRGRKRHLIIGAVLPMLIALCGALLAITWLPELPDPVAIHWGGKGADGFGSAWTLILLPIGITLVFTIFTELALSSARRRGRLTANDKILFVGRHFLSVLLTVGTIGSLAAQRSLDDAADAPDIAGPMLAGVLGGLLLATLVWFVLPKAVSPSFDEEAEAQPIELAPDERVFWQRTVRISGAVVALIVGVLVFAGGAGILASLGSASGLPFAIGISVCVILTYTGMSFWRVRADRRGFLVRGALGWPRISIPNAEIAEVRVIEVNPTADFGGWGWRMASGRRSGIIMRKGPAIEITRTDGRRLVVTVDDAEVGAGVLTSLTRSS